MAGETNVGTTQNAPAAATSGGPDRPSGGKDDPHRDTLAGGTTNPQGGVTTDGTQVANAAGDRPTTGDRPAEKVERKKAEKVDPAQKEAADGDVVSHDPAWDEPEGTVHHDQFRTSFPKEQSATSRLG